MAEAILNAKGGPAFTAYSAGSHPSGKVRPEALRQLEQAHIGITSLRSKSWDEFSRPGSPTMDFVFTGFEVLVVMGELGDVAIVSCRLRSGQSASTGNGDGSVLTLGPCDLFSPRCWPCDEWEEAAGVEPP